MSNKAVYIVLSILFGPKKICSFHVPYIFPVEGCIFLLSVYFSNQRRLNIPILKMYLSQKSLLHIFWIVICHNHYYHILSYLSYSIIIFKIKEGCMLHILYTPQVNESYVSFESVDDGKLLFYCILGCVFSEGSSLLLDSSSLCVLC